MLVFSLASKAIERLIKIKLMDNSMMKAPQLCQHGDESNAKIYSPDAYAGTAQAACIGNAPCNQSQLF
ncbi:hypothetical protein C1X61_01120 [Pseudomonas sp. FW215-T2]|nr:hypothetical protein C1X61_01120 [Pseudomonas sp. FW215-T2]PNA13015.1 hypothetical protein C1X62_11295 [Pseudomonas sp. FW215-R3]PNB36530.1 hypothetical protein C1X63_17250 [Pseudomonas sp. FW305-131]